MKQKLNFITIGVEDLEKMKTFYRDIMGWTPLKDSDGIVFFKLNCFILALFPARELANDIGIENDGNGFKKFTMAINFSSEKEVNEQFNYLENNGVKIMKAPEKVFWGGYSGYFSDPENNYWELAYNPFLEMDEEGNVINHS
ncbi:MAG TPA: VOC family protein [Bacteroidia bacterium]|nr:VOC family protein [Bacteroidia bacterium]